MHHHIVTTTHAHVSACQVYTHQDGLCVRLHSTTTHMVVTMTHHDAHMVVATTHMVVTMTHHDASSPPPPPPPCLARLFAGQVYAKTASVLPPGAVRGLLDALASMHRHAHGADMDMELRRRLAVQQVRGGGGAGGSGARHAAMCTVIMSCHASWVA